MTDTANKRASALNLSQPWRGMLPLPDATADAGDRAQSAFMYRGLFDGGTPPEPSPVNNEWIIRARRRGRR